MCARNPSNPCYLFSAGCTTDADCGGSNLSCRKTDALNKPLAVNYCWSPAKARDDFATLSVGTVNKVIPVLDNDIDEALAESREALARFERLGVRWICTTAGSPYYNPHVQRPALFPPVDGYDPPEDPLRGVARQIQATARLKAAFPQMVFVGSAYSYLQEWLPHVAQHNVRCGLIDIVGLGRIALSYPELPADLLSGAALRRKLFCRTFSDCTTGPRLGLVSGCYPLDNFYSARPEAVQIRNLRTHAATS